MRLSRLAKKSLHSMREVPGQLNGPVGQHLHALIAAQWLEITQVELKPAALCGDDPVDLADIGFCAVGCQPHDLALISVLCIADEFANHGIEATQRVRKKDTLQHINLIALTACHHGGDEISGTVVAETGGLFPGRAIVSARDMRNVMLQTVLLKPEL